MAYAGLFVQLHGIDDPEKARDEVEKTLINKFCPAYESDIEVTLEEMA